MVPSAGLTPGRLTLCRRSDGISTHCRVRTMVAFVASAIFARASQLPEPDYKHWNSDTFSRKLKGAFYRR